MNFGDLVMAVASMAVVLALVIAPLGMAFVSVWGLESGYMVSLAVSVFLSALLGGYLFSSKIWQARREAISKITVLYAAFVMVMVGLGSATIADLGSMIREGYQGQYGATLSVSEWVNFESMHYDMFIAMTVGMVLLLGFVGLYAGSMLRQPKH